MGLEQENVERINGWKPLTEDQIAGVLKQIEASAEAPGEDQVRPKPVYVAGGRMYELSNGVVESGKHPAAEPYKWPVAHDVRPAAQSLGANGRCADCHDEKSPFIFGQVEIDSPVNSKGDSPETNREMVSFEGLNSGYYQMFAFTFLFRPWLKVVVILSCILLGTVLLLFALKGLDHIVKVLGNKE